MESYFVRLASHSALWFVHRMETHRPTEVSFLLKRLALQQIEHLEAVYHTIACLKKHDQLQLIVHACSGCTPIHPTRLDWFLWGCFGVAFSKYDTSGVWREMWRTSMFSRKIFTRVVLSHNVLILVFSSLFKTLLFLWLLTTKHSWNINTWKVFCITSDGKRFYILLVSKLRVFSVPFEGPAQVFCEN